MGRSQSVGDYIDAVASSSPTPGGGSVSATSGAMGAALGEMVCRLTAERTSNKESAALLEQAGVELTKIREKLLGLATDDEAAYTDYRSAMALPRATPEEKEHRNAAIQTATLHASRVPLESARSCMTALCSMETGARHGSRYALADVLVGSELLRAAASGSAILVRTNTRMLRDAHLPSEIEGDLETIVATIDEQLSEIRQAVEDRLS